MIISKDVQDNIFTPPPLHQQYIVF